MPREKHVVLYDSDCALCTFQMRMITWLDWFNKVEWIPINDERSDDIAPELTREELREAIHCITPQDKIHRGARCVRFLGMRMPLLVPIALFLWIPGVIWVAEKFYMWVSRNRYTLSKIFGCKGACAIMPERKTKKKGEPAPQGSSSTDASGSAN